MNEYYKYSALLSSLFQKPTQNCEYMYRVQNLMMKSYLGIFHLFFILAKKKILINFEYNN